MLNRLICFISALIVASYSIAALALNLDEARNKGLVGETMDGYVAIVGSSPSSEVKALVADVNSQRKAIYTSISQKNKQPVNVVATLAGKKKIEEMPSGWYYKDLSGRWIQK